ncbi:MAG: DUF1232 domain-containing protein [Selenomonadaceae bacterium]|nr:DUF1232 domain-containing protein [Selenomonadaceae bacterium]
MAKEYTEKDFDEKTLNKYSENYTDKGLWDKIKENAKTIGAGLIYKAFQLYYVTQNPACPMKVKATILGALGYLISPIDFIPDLLPVVGYTDDAAAIAVAVAMAQMYIDDDVKFKAKKKIGDLLGDNFVREIE